MSDKEASRPKRYLAMADGTTRRDREDPPWGEESLTLHVARTSIVVTGASRAQADVIRSGWPAWLDRRPSDAPAPASFACELRRAPLADFREWDCRGFEYDLAFDRAAGSVRFQGLEMYAQLEWKESRGTLSTCTEEPQVFRETFENFLRVLSAYRLLHQGGVLLHAASVVETDGAHLFLGASGDGKTTLSRLALASGRNVPSDDLNLVAPPVPGRPGLRLLGSPFVGEIGDRRPIDLPLRALYRLRKGAEEAIRPLSRACAEACLLAGASFVNHDRHHAEALFRSVEILAASSPAFELTFRKDGNVWPLLHRKEAEAVPVGASHG